MIAATAPVKTSSKIVALIVICFGAPGLGAMQGARAQLVSDTDNGRYTLSPMADGVVRLDTRTGAVSNCSDKGNGWACYLLPDERAALDEEIGRLQRENENLKVQLSERPPSAAGKN